MAAAAVGAALLRFPGLLYPIGADEAGFTLVARAWDPQPDSPYGAYWVDRPPTLVAVYGLTDAIGGPYAVRLLAAAGCALLVVLSAATAREVLRHAGQWEERFVTRTGAWTAVLAAAFTSTAMIDPIMAKGEILGIPFVLLAFHLALRALRRGRTDPPALLLAAAAGMASMLAVVMKQNLVAGLVFGTVLLVGARLEHRITTPELLRLGGAALLGAAVPVVATVAWAQAAGVRLEALWYAVFGFRRDALEVIAGDSAAGPLERGLLLLGIAIGSGAVFVLAGVALHRRRIWRFDRTITAATGLVVVVDLLGLLLGGSFWRPYLFALVPGMVLCAALLLAVRDKPAHRARVLVVAAAVVSVVATAVWTTVDLAGRAPSGMVRTGMALRHAAEPGDTVVVYGGRAEIVLTSRMHSPYRHLWSLPMRTLDPDLTELRSVMTGPEAPTWVVLWVPLEGWDGNGAPLRPVLERDYRRHGEGCGDSSIYLRKGVSRPPLAIDC